MRSAHILLMICLFFSSAGFAQSPPRAPIPSEGAVAEATKLIADVYKQDYEQAKTVAQKQKLAQKMLDDAQASKDDPSARYALLQVAKKIAIGIGDVETAILAIERSANVFDVDANSQRQQLFEDIAGQVKSADDNYALARYIGRETAALLQDNQLNAAQSLADLALATAKKAKDPDLVKQWSRRQTQLKERQLAWTKAQAALEVLKGSPNDANANDEAGKYACCFQHDWTRGLSMLALGNDKDLAPLAEKELRGVSASADKLALADSWYDMGMMRSEVEKLALHQHAATLYLGILPTLQALTLRRVEKRVEEIAAANSPFQKDEWVEILDYVQLPKHLVENQWQREGLSIATHQEEHCKAFRIPVEINGNYEIRIKATKIKGAEGLAISLSRPVNNCDFLLGCYGGKLSGINLVNKTELNSDRNTSRVDSKPLQNGRTFQYAIQVEARDDQAVIGSTIENVRFTRWAGPIASLSPYFPEWKGSIYVRHCGQGFAVHSVQLKLKSGAAWLVD